MIYNITANNCPAVKCFIIIFLLFFLSASHHFSLWLLMLIFCYPFGKFPIVHARTAALITGHQISYGMTLDN